MTFRPMTTTARLLLLIALPLALVACGAKKEAAHEHEGEHAEAAAEEFERGPHGGRLLEDGDFALEVTIYEDGAPPQFRMFPYFKGKPVTAKDVTVTTALTRLGGKVDQFTFAPQADYLTGSGVVREPHSFDVAVNATYQGAAHAWKYASYEGRTTITPQAAQAGGVKVAQAGPATVGDTLDLAGKVTLQAAGRAEVRAWFPGRVMSMTVNVGDQVKRGQTIARVESSNSLQTYSIPAPISGVVIERGVNVGDVAADNALYVIADPAKVQAEFFVFPRDAERVRAGQAIEIKTLGGDTHAVSKIAAFLPLTNLETQTLTARASLPDGSWRPGTAVEGKVQVSNQQIPLAVRTEALQRFRDFDVVFAKVGDAYEVRMLTLGRQTPEWTEVLGGLEPGETYVTEGAFLIRADIEKSGASHDH